MIEKSVRDRLIGSAGDLYNLRGIQSVGMDDLRTATGISLKAIYGAFPSKNAIILAVLDKRHDDWTTSLSHRVSLVADPEEKLLEVYEYLFDWFSEPGFRGCGFINSFAELGAVNPEVRQRVQEHKEAFQTFIAELVTAAHAEPELAAQLAILAEGAQTTAAIAGTTSSAKHARRAAEILIAAALMPTP